MKPHARIALKDIAEWGRGRAFWVYDHVMAAIPGAVLIVPVHVIEGSLRELCALCPVPYETALAVMDQERRLEFADVLALELAPEVRWPVVSVLAGEGAWFAARLQQYRSRVYLHERGMRLAVADEYLIRESTRGGYGQSATA